MHHYSSLEFGKMNNTYTCSPSFIYNLGLTSRSFTNLVHAFMNSLVCINVRKLLWFSKDKDQDHSKNQNDFFK